MIYATGYILYDPDRVRYYSEYWWKPVISDTPMSRPEFPRIYGSRAKAEQVLRTRSRQGCEVREIHLSDTPTETE